MQVNEYQTLAAVTEAPVTEELKARFESVRSSMLGMMSVHLRQSKVVDTLKRCVYYGKRPEIAEQLAILEEMEVRDKLVSSILTLPLAEDWHVRFFHAVLGLHTEVGELWEALDKLSKFDYPWEATEELDEVCTNVKEELGDLCWYIVLVCNVMNINFDDVLGSNIRKLNEKRYKGKGFTEGNAVNRDLVAESEALAETVPVEPDQKFITVETTVLFNRVQVYRYIWELTVLADATFPTAAETLAPPYGRSVAPISDEPCPASVGCLARELSAVDRETA